MNGMTMATDPNLIIEDQQSELALEPMMKVDAGAVPVDPVTLEQEPVAPEEEVKVAGSMTGFVKAARKLSETIDEAEVKTEDVTPPPQPMSQVIEGEIVLQSVPEASAKEFRESLNLPDDFDVKLPNLTRRINRTPENPEGEIVNVFDSEEGANQWINNMHRIFDEQIKVATRGQRPLETMVKSAKAMGMHGALIELLDRKVGEAFNSEQMYRALWVRSAIAHEMDRVVKEGTDEELLRLLPFAASIEMQTSGAIAEGGRAMSVLSHAGKFSMSDAAMKSLPELINAYGLKEETISNIRFAYQAIPETSEKMTFLRIIAKGINKGMDLFAEAYVSSLLTSIPTHMINVLGNAIFGAIQIPERMVAGAVGAVRVNLFKNMTAKDRVYMGESLEMLRGLSDGVPAALKAAAKALKTEEGTFGGPRATKIDTRETKAISSEFLGLDPTGTFGKFVDMTGIITRFMGSRMLLTEDEFAKGLLFHMDLRAQARRTMERQIEQGMSEAEAIKSGARVLAGMDANIVKSAEDFAVRGTFQGDLGPIASFFNKGFSHPLMKIWVPFFRTPTKIGVEILQRTPLGALLPTGFWTEFAQGGAKADAALGRMIFGTGVFATIASMSTGEMIPGFKINGAQPQDKNAAAAWRRNGWQEYSFAVQQDDGTWKNYEYGRLAPVGGIFAMAADYANYSQYSDNDSELEELFLGAGGALFNVMSELPMLQGIFSITELAGSEYEDFNKKFDRAYELMVKQVSGAVITAVPLAPTGPLFASIERSIDPLASDPKLSTMDTQNALQTSSTARGFYEALNRIKSRNPFFSDTVPPKLNLYGEPMKQCENGAWCFISPLRVTTTKGNVVDEEMVNLGLGVPMPTRTQRGVRLTSDQYNDMLVRINELGNETMLEEMERVIELDVYQSADIAGVGGKIEQLKSVLTRRKKMVLDEMFADDDFGLGEKKLEIEDYFKRQGVRMKQ